MRYLVPLCLICLCPLFTSLSAAASPCLAHTMHILGSSGSREEERGRWLGNQVGAPLHPAVGDSSSLLLTCFLPSLMHFHRDLPGDAGSENRLCLTYRSRGAQVDGIAHFSHIIWSKTRILSTLTSRTACCFLLTSGFL